MNEEYLDPFEQYRMQAALTERQGDNQQKLYAPQIQEQIAQAQAVVIAQTDPIKVLKEIQLRMNGKIKNSDGEEEQLWEPVMNQKGIGRMMFLLNSVLNDSTRLASTKEDKTSKIMIQFSNDVTRDLANHWREYGIMDMSMCDFIVNSMILPALLVLTRSEDRNEKNWLGRVSFENINPASQYKKEKSSWIEKFKL